MAIPVVNTTITDGSLGIIQPVASNVQAKIGVCSTATATVQASLLVQSTTGGSGIAYTAIPLGALGNAISITYAAPAGGTSTVSVVGNSISVSPKTGETNTGLLAIIQASTAATLVNSVITGVGSDVIVARVTAPLASGVTGTINTIFAETQVTQAQTDLGSGPLTEAVAHSLQVAGGTVYAMPVNPSVAGVAGSVTKNGSAGAGVVTVAGAPFDSYSVTVAVVTSGVLGVATFKYSQDGGVSFSNVYTIPGGGTFVIPSTGLTLTFSAATYGAPDTFTFVTTAPGFSVTDVQNAMTALLADPRTWGWVHIVGPAATPAAAAALGAAMDVIMAAAATNFRYAFSVIEVPTATDASILTAFASFASVRTMVCPGTCTLTSGISGRSATRSAAWPVTARMAFVPISEHLGRVNTGALPGVTALQRDEGVTPGLDALNFTTLRTIVGMPGFYVTAGHMFTAPTSDFQLSQNRRVMDVACAITRTLLLTFLNDSLRVTKANGFLFPADADKIQRYVGGGLNTALVGPGYASATSLVVNPANNILSSKQLLVTTRITPLGYASDIEQSIGFLNPTLQIN